MILSLLYDLALTCFLPKLLYQRIFQGKYRGNFLQRLGIGFPKIDKGRRKLVWIHAVSLGETKAIAPLAAKIKGEFPDALVVISSITETGFREAKKSLPFALHHVYLPFDISWIIRRIVRRIAPDYVILSETDLWVNFLSAAKGAGAKIILVNGKLSQKTGQKYQRFSLLPRAIWPNIDLFCLQSTIYKERFERAGAPKARLTVTGNMKHDRKISLLDERAKREWRAKLGIASQDSVLVLACTHDPEERLLLEAVKGLSKLKVLLAPRHPERFDEVAEILKRGDIPYQRYSQMRENPTEKVILIDQMGLLDPCYQIATLALVGGSFTPKVGGHNILEPCAFGTPVLFGPFMHAQPDMVHLIQEFGAGKQIAAEQITSEIAFLLANEEERKKYSKAAEKMMAECRGATDRTFSAFLSLWQIKPSAIV